MSLLVTNYKYLLSTLHLDHCLNLLVCNRIPHNPSPTPPPPPENSEIQEIPIILHSLAYNNILFITDIDITLMSIFIKKLTLSQIINAITPTI